MVRRAFGTAFSDDELEDLYSSAWLSTLAALERKPRELSDEELRRYLMTAVANQASREMRRRGRKPTVPIDAVSESLDPTITPDEAAAQSENSRVTRDILGSLPPRRRAVLVFRYGWGLEPNEVCSLVDGLSLRAYRKEIERGVAEVAKKMRMVEAGGWCEAREPLLRAVAAGVADQDEKRQAQQHLAHCRSCAGFVSRLNGHLHELGSSVALTGVADVVAAGDTSVADRGVALLERGKHAISSLANRGSDVAEQASQVATAGGTRGAGAAGAGAVAKLAGLGAVPKLVAACIGTGAAATACVAAGVVPGVTLDREPAGDPVKAEQAVERDRSDKKRHAALSVAVSDPAPTPATPPDAPPETSIEGHPEPAAPEPTPPPEPAPAPEPPPPTVQEFEPVGSPVAGSAPAGSSSTSGGGGGGSSSGDFGP